MVHILFDAGSTDFFLRTLHRWFPDISTLKDVENIYKNHATLFAEFELEFRSRTEPQLKFYIENIATLNSDLTEKTHYWNSVFDEQIQTFNQRMETGTTKDSTLNIATNVNPNGIMKFKLKITVFFLRETKNIRLSRKLKPIQREIKKNQQMKYRLEHALAIIIDKEQHKYHNAYEFISQHQEFLAGARGEEHVINALKDLPDSYYLLNDVKFDLYRSVYWKRGGEYVRRAQVDHIVVGPTGVFMIETKNWRRSTFNENRGAPHKQIERAEFIAYLALFQNFHPKIPVKCVVVTMHKMQKLHVPYVDQVCVTELKDYLLHKKVCLEPERIQQVIRALQ